MLITKAVILILASIGCVISDPTESFHLEGVSLTAATMTVIANATSNNQYVLKPFDAVQFHGNASSDGMAAMIQKISLREVVPSLTRPFSQLWTHSGMIVDHTVFPFLPENKLYIYESVFSGQIMGVGQSKVLPVDFPPADYHLGPSIRDFDAVLAETQGDVAITPLSPVYRAHMNDLIAKDPNFLVDIHEKYKSYGFPLNLRSVAAADEDLYEFDTSISHTLSKFGIATHGKTIFCSELVSTIYRDAGLPSFLEKEPAQFSPLEVQTVQEFDNVVIYVKEGNDILVKDGKAVESKRTTAAHDRLKEIAHQSEMWVKMGPAAGVPSSQPDGSPSESAVTNINGTAIFLARATIGTSIAVGKIEDGWKAPQVSYLNTEVPINFGHEVLVSYKGLKWVPAKNGKVPENAVIVGVDDDGNLVHAARGEIFHETSFFGLWKQKSRAIGLGKIGDKGYTGAQIVQDGKVTEIQEYEVLCHDN